MAVWTTTWSMYMTRSVQGTGQQVDTQYSSRNLGSDSHTYYRIPDARSDGWRYKISTTEHSGYAHPRFYVHCTSHRSGSRWS